MLPRSDAESGSPAAVVPGPPPATDAAPAAAPPAAAPLSAAPPAKDAPAAAPPSAASLSASPPATDALAAASPSAASPSAASLSAASPATDVPADEAPPTKTTPDTIPADAPTGDGAGETAPASGRGRRRWRPWSTADLDPERPPLRGWVAALLAIASGALLVPAFPPHDLWWLAPVAVAMLAAAVHRQRARRGAWLGLLHGLVFFVILLEWVGIYVGEAFVYLLGAVEAAYVAGLGALLAASSRAVDRYRWSWPLVVGAGWVTQEAVRGRWPFGGFPWGRLAFAETDGPLLHLASVAGAPLVTFATAALGGLLVAALWRRWPLTDYPLARRLLAATPPPHQRPPAAASAGSPLAASAGSARSAGSAVAGSAAADARASRGRRAGVRAAAWLGAVGVVLLAAWFLPTPKADGRNVTVAVIQGNVPRLGLDFNAQRRAVLDNHVTRTLTLARDVAAGRAKQPDLVIWPENASDIDPLINEDARAEIDEAATAIKAPILVGAVLRGPGEYLTNAGLVWVPGEGPTDRYEKRHPVPFGEYIPLRSLARKITTKVDLVRRDFKAGTEIGTVGMPTPTAGTVQVGDVICFEVAYDGLVTDTVNAGAQILAVQTNNATFGLSGESPQQVAMARLRAVEHGKWSVVASTSGISATIGPNGHIYDHAGLFSAGTLIRSLALSEDRTLATAVGQWPEAAFCTLSGVALVAAAALRRRRAAGVGRTTEEG
ncbi:apolipoprotein N-acyltransferase [Cryptosporangium japonicum]|uniref:Apolipoprotein N-acyltransferase n=1 Tax=Cryptosporangium japonicum TaxID=80872 RepID=A0ABN0V6Z3_9ACTN